MAEERKDSQVTAGQKPEVWRIKLNVAGFYYKRRFYPCVRIPDPKEVGFMFETADRHIKDYCLDKLGGKLIE